MRIHNSRKPIEQLVSRPLLAFQRKPAGLWWSQDTDWRDLVEGAATAAARKRTIGDHFYEVVLDPSFRLLRLDSMDDLLEFSRGYAQPMPHAPEGFFWQTGDRQHYDPAQDDQIGRGRLRAFLVDWPAVSKEWDGIEVAIPVGANRGDRPFVEWLDRDWDIPSGCAWRVDRLEIFPRPTLETELPSP